MSLCLCLSLCPGYFLWLRTGFVVFKDQCQASCSFLVRSKLIKTCCFLASRSRKLPSHGPFFLEEHPVACRGDLDTSITTSAVNVSIFRSAAAVNGGGFPASLGTLSSLDVPLTFNVQPDPCFRGLIVLLATAKTPFDQPPNLTLLRMSSSLSCVRQVCQCHKWWLRRSDKLDPLLRSSSSLLCAFVQNKSRYTSSWFLSFRLLESILPVCYWALLRLWFF